MFQASHQKLGNILKKSVSKIIKEGDFDLVMHFAGLIRVDESVKEPEKYNDYNCEKTN